MASTHSGSRSPEVELGNEAGGAATREIGGKFGFWRLKRREGRVDLWVVSGGGGGGGGGGGFWCIARGGREGRFGKRDSLISSPSLMGVLVVGLTVVFKMAVWIGVVMIRLSCSCD